MPLVKKVSPRVQYRLQQSERVNNSPNLAEKFPQLRKLQVNIDHLDSAGVGRDGGMKYRANLEHAKSIFYVNCIYQDCIGGDFDLSTVLASAIEHKHKIAEGELRCQGNRVHSNQKKAGPCQGILRFKFTLGY